MGEEGRKPASGAGSREHEASRSDGSPDAEPETAVQSDSSDSSEPDTETAAEADSGESSAPDSEESSDSGSNGRNRSKGAGKAEGEDTHPTAPSLGPNTTIEREPVEERLARHDQSTEDAMGKDKRRPVVGQSYGPSKARQLTLYGIFLAVVAAVLIGGALLVSALDTPVGKHVPQSAPWAQPNAKQHPPKPLQ